MIVSGSLLNVLGGCSSDSKTGTDASVGTGGTSGNADSGGTGGTAGAGGGGGAGGGTGMDASIAADTNKPADSDTAGGTSMSFFITSRTGDGKLGGLDGAAKICQDLAGAVGAGGKTWHAYLSTNNPKVDAKTRIGSGPWYNQRMVKIADNIDNLHKTIDGGMGRTPNNMLSSTTGLTEKGEMVPFEGATNQHDILTGSNMDGTALDGQTCTNWTGQGTARVGHFNQAGGGQNPNSWNSAHPSQGCSAADFVATGGAGRFYCFAIN